MTDATRVTEFHDAFETGRLDADRWVPAYLPHWSTAERTAARYRFDGGRLVLEIGPDQGPWNPEHDGEVRVSSIQTGAYSGPVGSSIGQHRFRPDLTVRRDVPIARLYTPQFGRIAARFTVCPDPDTMVALWMIGFEDDPERSAEICIGEVFGSDVGPGGIRVGVGIRPHHDPALVDDFEQVALDLDATEPHEYAIDWTAGRVEYLVDDAIVKVSAQAPDYPMQLMLGIYAFSEVATDREPRRFVVDWVRGYPPREVRPA